MKTKWITQGISFSDAEFLASARRRADSLGLSLSDYVCRMIEEDIVRGGPLTIHPRERVNSAIKDGVARTVRRTARFVRKNPKPPAPTLSQ